MEGYGRHSRSHFKAAPPHPSSAVAGAGNGTGFYKKPYGNGGGAGGNAFMAYDDVFGGPPKFGATPFAPRAEDYSEIFGSFRSSRTSSIPMLDLPPVDNSVDAFEVLGCTGLEYTEIFGGFDFADFAASYDELFRRSDGSEESSDDAWTPVGTESPSEASDPYASSGRNQYFLNSDFHETPEDTMFDASYNNVKLGTTEDTEQTDEGQHSFVSGYTYMVEGSTTRKEDEERYSSGVADDIILCEDSSGNISVETRRKTASSRSHSGVVKQSHGYEEPSHLPPLSKLRPTIDERKRDPAETIFEGGSLDFFDVELNAGSSSIAAAAAMKEAMDRAKLKLNSAKELRKREKDGVESMLFVNNGLKRDVKVKMAFDDSILRDDELQSKCESESSVIKMYGDNMQDASEVSQVLPDTLQPEDEVSRAAEPAQRETAKNQRLSLDPGLIEGDGEWKVTTECYEFLNSKTEHSLPGNIEKPVQEVNSCHFDNVNGRTMSLKQMEHNVEGMDASIKDHEDLKSSDEACNPRDNRRRLRATKAASRNAFHEKMLKLAQDVHKTVISDHVETQKRRNEGIEGDGAQRSPETWSVGGKSGRIYDQAAQQVQYDRKHEEESYESYLADSEIGSDEDLVQADCDKQGKEDCNLKGHQNGEKEAEAGKRVMSPRNENLSVLNQDLEQEGKRKSGKNEKQDSDVSLKKADEESTASKNEMREEVNTADKCEENAEVASSDCNGKILKESVDMATENIRKERINANDDPPTKSKRFERSNVTFKNEHEVDVYEKNEMEEPFKMIDLEKSQKMFECSAKNEELKMENKGALQSDFKVTDQDSNQKENLHLESEYFASIEPPTLDEEVLEMAGECDELKSSSSPSSLDGKDIKSFDMASEGEMKLENHVYEKETEFCSGTLNGQIESKVTEMEEFCITSRCPQKADAGQCMMSERKESARKQYPSSNINQRVSKEEKAVNGNVAAEDREMAEKLRRKEDSERELLREVQLENERELERELEKEQHVQKHEDELEKESLRKLVEEREKERLQKLEEEREKERLRKLEEEREKERLWKLEEETKERHRKLEEEREKEGLRKLEEEREKEEREKERLRKLEEEREKERLRKLEEEREKERLRKLEEEREKERLRKLEEEREKDKEKELEKLRLRRLEELRERERVKELEKDHLQKLEEERQKEREKDLEKERLRKLEEEWEREREREKDRMGVELKMPAAHERAAVERATVEARQRAMSEARERLEKVCAEAREKSFGKTSKEAQLRAERAAVERATAEARERAIEKAMTRDRVERSVSEKFSSSFREVELRHCSSSNDLWNSDKSDGVEGESAQRCKARLDRHRRTVERVAKALAEKNMRDLIAQREQTERNRFAETLDADIKRWSNGKEGNLRALLSTLQYILGSESGWQPIPLTEVITSAAVKKAYRKATLCVHPDKLQQRGATIQQKYICEKVFDLLKDGWNRFNSEER